VIASIRCSPDFAIANLPFILPRRVASKDLYHACRQDGRGRRVYQYPRYVHPACQLCYLEQKLIVPGAIPETLISALTQNDNLDVDGRPSKRRKVTKSGPYNLSDELSVSSTGIPLGYIPLTRLSLRLVSNQSQYPQHSKANNLPPFSSGLPRSICIY
jgi:hypothetical protein